MQITNQDVQVSSLVERVISRFRYSMLAKKVIRNSHSDEIRAF